MRLDEGLAKIREYFASVTPEELYQDLLQAGLGEVKSWADLGVGLTYNAKASMYSTNQSGFLSNATTTYDTDGSVLAEAA